MLEQVLCSGKQHWFKGQALGLAVKMLEQPVPSQGAWVKYWATAPDSTFLLTWTLGGSGSVSSNRVPATHLGDLDCIPASLLQPPKQA